MLRDTIEPFAYRTSPDQGNNIVVSIPDSYRLPVPKISRGRAAGLGAIVLSLTLAGCSVAKSDSKGDAQTAVAIAKKTAIVGDHEKSHLSPLERTATAQAIYAGAVETQQAETKQRSDKTATARAMKTAQTTGVDRAVRTMTAEAGATQTALAEPTATSKPKTEIPDSSLPPQLKNRHPYLKTAYKKTVQETGWTMMLPPTWGVADTKSIPLKDGQTEYIVKLQDTQKTHGPKGTTFSDPQTITITTIDISQNTISPTENQKNFFNFCYDKRGKKILELQNQATDLNADKYQPNVGWPNSPFIKVKVEGQEGCDFSYDEPPFSQTYGIDIYAPLNPTTIIEFSGDSPVNNNPPYLQDALAEVTGTFTTH